MFTAGGDYSKAPTKKAMCGCTDASHQEAREAIKAEHLLTIPEVYRRLGWRTPNGCASCRPAINYYLISTWPKEAKDDPQSRFINERVHANIQKDGTYSVVFGARCVPPAQTSRTLSGRIPASHSSSSTKGSTRLTGVGLLMSSNKMQTLAPDPASRPSSASGGEPMGWRRAARPHVRRTDALRRPRACLNYNKVLTTLEH